MVRWIFILISSLVFLISNEESRGQTYKSINKDGTISFSDNPTSSILTKDQDSKSATSDDPGEASSPSPRMTFDNKSSSAGLQKPAVEPLNPDLIKLWLPGKNWALEINTPGFEIESKEMAPSGNSIEVFASNKDTGVLLSAFLLKEPAKGDSTACREYYWNKVKQTPGKKVNTKMYEIGEMAIVEYVIPEFGGIPLNQKHLNAYLAREDKCINIHLSKINFETKDDVLFKSILNQINIARVDSKTSSNISAKDWLEAGHQYAINNKLDQAFEAFNKAISLDPNFSMAYVCRGNIYDMKGQFEKAMEDYKKAISLDPKSSQAYYDRGLAFGRSGNHDAAIKDFTKAIDLGTDYKSYYNRGIAYSRKDLLDAAIKDFTKVTELVPRYAMAYQDRGSAYYRKGKYDRAIEDYSKAIDLDPKLATAYHKRAVAYKKQSQNSKSLADYSAAARLYNDFGVGWASKGDLDKASKFFQAAIEASPDGPIGYYNMACLYSMKKDVEKACDFLRKAIQKGYSEWKVLEKDESLNNIKQSPCYREILAGK